MSLTPYYNKPDDDRDLEASFASLGDAQAYADAYGGEVEARGTAFVVGAGAKHDKAKDDLRAAQADGSKGTGLWKPKGKAKSSDDDDKSATRPGPSGGASS